MRKVEALDREADVLEYRLIRPEMYVENLECSEHSAGNPAVSAESRLLLEPVLYFTVYISCLAFFVH